MRTPGARRGWARAAAFAAVVIATPAVPLPAAHAAAADPLTDHSVQVSVDKVDPVTPRPSGKPNSLRISLTLTNTTDQSFSSVQVEVVRGNPINGQQALDTAISHPQPPDPSLAAPVPTKSGKPLTTALGAKGAVALTFETTTTTATPALLCLCRDAIYPLYITVHATDTSGNDVTLGIAQTYVPSIPDNASPHVGVSWVWPIIDRPHRMLDGAPFLDDDLAASVDGGRLDRVLQVAEAVVPHVSLTLVVDPELIDELAVMAAGKYQYLRNSKAVDGGGTTVAKGWLDRLKAVINTPGVRVSFTPPADPDLESLTRAGLTWTPTPNQAMQSRIDSVLGPMSFTPSLAWPVGESASADTLAAIARQGSTSVILDDGTLPATDTSTTPAGLATVQTTSGPLTAFVPSRTVERYVAPAITLGGPGRAALPQLVAEVAVRAVEESSAKPYVVITPPRLVNPDVTTARDAILSTATAFWATDLPLQTVPQSITASERAPLVPHVSAGLSSLALVAIRSVSMSVPALSSMFSSTDASTVLGDLPAASQRAASSGWEGDAGSRSAGDQAAGDLLRRVGDIEAGVQIVKPSSGTYTLAASNSPLPLTVWNKFAVPVTVQIQLRTANELPGFSADLLPPQVIAAGVKRQMQIPTHVNRTGRFEVLAVLLTPSREQVGTPVQLSIRSTALGTIGVVITVVAGAVLVFALLVRLVLRLRRRARTQQPSPVVIE